MTQFGFGSNTGGAFGAQSKPATGGFSFGSTTSTAPAFGASTATTTSTSGLIGFGSSNTASATPGFGGFGATSTPATGAFGATTTPAAGGFSFGAAKPAATSSGFSFGSNTGGLFQNKPFGTATSTAFGTGSAFGTATNTGFGTGTSTGFGTGANTGFGAGTNTGFGAGSNTGFGATATNTNFGAGQQSAVCPNVALYMAVCAPAYFNDERDDVLKRWNQLQAVWGCGKGYYAQGLPPVEFTPSNEFCRLKAVAYIKVPSHSPEEGLVELVIGRKLATVREQQTALVAELCKLFGGAQVCVEYVKEGSAHDTTRLCVYVQQRQPNGETKKANAMDVYNHLKADQNKQAVQNLCVTWATPLVALTEAQRKEYLATPPRGLDPLIWAQGKRQNPDPERYLPVPLVGFRELKARFKAQETESGMLQGQLDKVAEDVVSVQSRQATIQDQLAECGRQQRQMAHRLLHLVVRQECVRKQGVPIDGGEEDLRIRLEAMLSQLQAPTQYMGKLNEVISHLSALGNNHTSSVNASKKLSSGTESDVKEYLAFHQDAISEVVAQLKSDIGTFQAMVKSS